MFPNFQKLVVDNFPNEIFKLCSYIQEITLNLIQTFKITVYNTKYTKHTQIHFQKPKFQESIFFENYKFIKIRIFR